MKERKKVQLYSLQEKQSKRRNSFRCFSNGREKKTNHKLNTICVPFYYEKCLGKIVPYNGSFSRSLLK